MKCRLCDAAAVPYASSVYRYNEQTFDLVRCSECGIVFVSPFPDEETVKGFYTDEYFKEDYSFGIVEGDYLASEAVRIEEYRRILSKIASLTDGRKLLEVGCAAGGFLKEARSQGWEVTGVDISEWAVKTAKERFELDVRLGSLEEMNFPDASFDVIFFGDLLEHLPNPLSFISETARIIKPRDMGGIVVAKVPTYINSFYFRWLKNLSKITGLNKSEGNLSAILKLSESAPKLPPYHLFEHNSQTVRNIFSLGGLEVFDEERTLMVPEFLRKKTTPTSKFMLALFSTMKLFIESFGLPGGHVIVYAAKWGKAKFS